MQNMNGQMIINSSEILNNEASIVFNVDALKNFTVFSTICSSGNLTCFNLKNILNIFINILKIIDCFSSKSPPGLVIASDLSKQTIHENVR